MEIQAIRLQNLKRLVAEAGTIAAVARAANASEAYLSQILNGTPLPSGTPRGVGHALARRLEQGMDKPLGWMDTLERDERDEGDAEKPEIHPEENGYIPVRRVRLKLSAGVTGFEVEPEQGENGEGAPVFFRSDWLTQKGYKPEKLLTIKISGHSMEPGLFQGDLVVINTADTAPKDDAVFALNYEGEFVVKRLKRDAGEWWAASDNPDKIRYADKRCTEAVAIVGRVVYKQSEHI